MQKHLLLLFVASACGGGGQAGGDVAVDGCHPSHAPQFAVSFLMAGGWSLPPAIVWGDLNADQRPDLVLDRFVSINTSATAAPTTTFVTTDLGEEIIGRALADFDGDTRPDLVALRILRSGPGPSYLSILPNRTTPGATNASFAGSVTVTTWSGEDILVKVADINGDGKPDIVVGSYLNTVVGSEPTTVVSVIMNTTTGSTPTFAAPIDVALPGNLVALEVADLSGDGKPDLIVPTASGTDASLTVLVDTTATGASEPTFDTKTLGSLGPTTGWGLRGWLATGDLNGDGATDVAFSAERSASIWFFLNANVGETTPLLLSRDPGAGIAIADIDGDGALDLMSNDYVYEQDPFKGRVTYYLSPSCGATTLFGDGNHSERVTGRTPGDVALIDLNADGRLDAIASTGATGGGFAVQFTAY